MENIFQTLHIQQTITIVLHTKKIFLSHFQSDIKTKENQYVFKKKKKNPKTNHFYEKYIYLLSKKIECKYRKGKTYIHFCIYI